MTMKELITGSLAFTTCMEGSVDYRPKWLNNIGFPFENVRLDVMDPRIENRQQAIPLFFFQSLFRDQVGCQADHGQRR